MHLNTLFCNYLIYYAINMISYTLKRFTIQLIDFVNNLLVPVEGFNQYQISGKKKRHAGVEHEPRRLENLGLPLRYTVLSIGLAAKALKYKYFSRLRHRFFVTNRCLRHFSTPAPCSPKVLGGIITRCLRLQRAGNENHLWYRVDFWNR